MRCAPPKPGSASCRRRILRARGALDLQEPSFAELAEGLRLLYRFLLVLTVAAPPVDVMHSTAAGFSGLPCVVARLTRGTPYLLTEHGVYLREQYLNLRRHVPSPFVRAMLYRLMESVVRLRYAPRSVGMMQNAQV